MPRGPGSVPSEDRRGVHALDPLAQEDPVPERRRELLGQGLHPGCRQRRHPAGEHPREQQRISIRSAAVVLQQDAGEEPVDDPSQQTVHAGAVKRGGAIDVVTPGQHVRQRGASTRSGQGRSPPQHGGHLAGPAQRRTNRLREQSWSPQRVPQHDGAGLGHGGDPRPEALEPERADVHPALDGRIGRVEELEAAVDEESVHAIGADPTPDGIGLLEHEDVVPRLVERPCAAQTRHPSSYDQHVGIHAPRLVPRHQRVVALRACGEGATDRQQTARPRRRPCDLGPATSARHFHSSEWKLIAPGSAYEQPGAQ